MVERGYGKTLRIQNDGGWCHVINRGIDRPSIYRDERDWKHFLELLETASLPKVEEALEGRSLLQKSL